MTNEELRELKNALAKLLPETVRVSDAGNLFYTGTDDLFPDEGLEHLCYLAEQKLTTKQAEDYVDYMMALDCGIFGAIFAPWHTKARLILLLQGGNHG